VKELLRNHYPAIILLIVVVFVLAGCSAITPEETRHDRLPVPSLSPPCASVDNLDLAEGNIWRSIGPYGGSIRAIAMNPENPNIVYIATYGAGIYRSSDGGNSWHPASTGLENTSITALIIDPASPETLYAGTEGLPDNTNVYRSENGGETWVRLTDRMECFADEVTSLTISPEGLYMGSMAVFKYESGPWKEPSLGWKRLSDNWLGNGFIHIAFDPSKLNTLYAGTYQGGLFRSEDGGVTWQTIGQGPFANSLMIKVKVDPSNSSRLLAGGYDGLFKSEDRGLSWLPVLSDQIEVIVFHPTKVGFVLVGSDHGLWTSFDAGETWSSVSRLQGIRVDSLGLNLDEPEEIFAGTHKSGLFRSRDGGSSWEAINYGIANTFVSALSTDPSVPKRLYAGTLGDGLFITDDMGVSWSHVGGELAGTSVKALLASSTNPGSIFAGTWDGLFMSQDAGQTWARSSPPLDGKQVVSLAASQTGAIYAGTYGDGLFTSSDSGNTWRVTDSPQLYVTAIVVGYNDPELVFVGTLGGVFRSNDGGKTWELSSGGLRDLSIQELTIDSETDYLYAATGDGIYLSRNQGAGWERRSDVLGYDYFRTIIVKEKIIAASWKGVFTSNKDDFSWTTHSFGLLNNRINTAIITDEDIVVGTYGGGAYVLRPVCWPLYGQVRDSLTGMPLFARVIVEPGGFVTYSDVDGGYSFDNLPPAQYDVTAELNDGKQSDMINVDLDTKAEIRLDLTISADLSVNSSPIAIIGPPPNTEVLRGEITQLCASVPILEALADNMEVVWKSDKEGLLGSSSFNELGISRIDTRFLSCGLHNITLDLISGNKIIGKASNWLNVQEPNELHAIGMAWDSAYLWATVERSVPGLVYQLSVIDGHLSVVNTYLHPAPAPGSIAWDGKSFWTTGHEGPDPFRSWEGGTVYLYRHSINGGLPVVNRYPRTYEFEFPQAGLTWDGEHLWCSEGNSIVRLDMVDSDPVIATRYQAPGHQTRAIEWVNGDLWVVDSESDYLFKLDIDADLAVEGWCDPGMIGGYGMAWDGSGFWLWTIKNPHLQYFVPGRDCPKP